VFVSRLDEHVPFLLRYSPPLLGLVFVWAAWVVLQDQMWRPLPVQEEDKVEWCESAAF
jgi:hypothetical protein